MRPAQIWFFTLNLAGVFLGLVWTAYEFYIEARHMELNVIASL